MMSIAESQAKKKKKRINKYRKKRINEYRETNLLINEYLTKLLSNFKKV